MEISGKTIAVLDLVSGTSKSGNAWQKREFVIETEGQYPKKICFQIFGQKVNDCPAVGDDVTVSFDAESREWQGRWFTQLNAWKVEKQGAQPAPAATAIPTPPPAQFTQPAQSNTDGGDELPF